jgi:glutamine synthetase
MSIFLGDQLTDVFEQIQAGGAKSSKAASMLEIGVDTLPPLPKHAGDRNRTSPIAFTGNKFEFRAVGSGQSIAGPLLVWNTIVAESLDYIATKLETATGSFEEAVQGLLQEIITAHGRVIFNGDGYTEAWHLEAAQRGLPNLRNSVDALPALADAEAIELFARYHVLNERETTSRLEVKLEQYVKEVHVEAALTAEIAKTMIYPAAVRYQSELAAAAANLKAVGIKADTAVLKEVTEAADCLIQSIAELELAAAHEADDLHAEAEYLCHTVLPTMLVVRSYADKLEGLVADDLWPLPTYQEMLFIK